jgi:hypothetical protein
MEVGFPFYISLIPVAISAAGLLLGLFLLIKVSKILGVLVCVFGLMFGLLFGPMLLMDRVVVDDRHIQQNTGLWFDQMEKGFDFEGMERITITTGHDMKNREIEIWIAQYRDRPDEEIDPGDLWEMHGDAIVEYLKKLGIQVLRSPR